MCSSEDHLQFVCPQGYKQRNAYIATQGPLVNTVNDFWRMMWEFKSKTLVTLCQLSEGGEESYYPFCPAKENEKVLYGKVYVTLQSITPFDKFTQRKYMIYDEKVKYGCSCYIFTYKSSTLSV